MAEIKVTVLSRVKFKGTDVVYSHTGSGQVIVLLHGFLEERSMWDRVALVLAKTCRVIAIDLLGHGDSGCTGYVHSMEEQAEAVRTVLCAEDVSECTVLGHSMGGYVGLALAEVYPEMVEGIVLFHSTAYPDIPEKQVDRERVISLVQRNKEVYINAAIPSLFAAAHVAEHSDAIKEVIKTAKTFSKQGIIANIRGMMVRPDRTAVLKKKGLRKLIIHGTEDPVISNQSIQEQVSSGSDIRLELLDGVGHMGHIESPISCEQIITDFCTSVHG